MSRNLFHPLKWQIASAISSRIGLLQSYRFSSTYAHLHNELTSRTLPLLYDHLSPTHSHLLNIALADHLPNLTAPSSFERPPQSPHHVLPPAHHLLYFPPPIPSALLLPDGTDPLQSPGPPFVRRMWAGGDVRFTNSRAAYTELALNSKRAVCAERITDVTIKGAPGVEKVFVRVERRIGLCGTAEGEAAIRARLALESGAADGALIVESRTIVFLRERSGEELARVRAAVNTPARLAQSPTYAPHHPPDYAHTLVPDARLLFRYSALTYNAHAIHLDPEYCREVEGHRAMLVHGPLSFTLLLTILRLHLFEAYLARGDRDAGYEAVQEVEYRTLAPLYCGEPLRLCGRRVDAGKFEIWAETPEGGLAVRGIVKTGIVSLLEHVESPEAMFEDLAMNLVGGH